MPPLQVVPRRKLQITFDEKRQNEVMVVTALLVFDIEYMWRVSCQKNDKSAESRPIPRCPGHIENETEYDLRTRCPEEFYLPKTTPRDEKVFNVMQI